jgi:hypothetical protein
LRTRALQLQPGASSIVGSALGVAAGQRALLVTGSRTVAGQQIDLTKTVRLFIPTSGRTFGTIGNILSFQVTRALVLFPGFVSLFGQEIGFIKGKKPTWTGEVSRVTYAISGKQRRLNAVGPDSTALKVTGPSNVVVIRRRA